MEEKYKDCQLTEHIRMLGRLKKELSPLSEGKYRELLLTNRQYAFARIQDDKAVIVAVNNDENPAHVSIPVAGRRKCGKRRYRRAGQCGKWPHQRRTFTGRKPDCICKYLKL